MIPANKKMALLKYRAGLAAIVRHVSELAAL